MLTNWARVIIVIDPMRKPGLYRFMAAKRHNRIGRSDLDRYFAHSTEPGKVLWIEAASEEVKSSTVSKNCQPADLLALVPEHEPISKEVLTVQAKEILGIGEIFFKKSCWKYVSKQA